MNPLDEVRSSWASLASEINAADESILVELRSRFLGKKGEIPGLMRHLGAVPGPEKPAYGACVQALRQEVESVLDRRQEQLRQDALKGVMTSLKANGHPVVRAEVRDGHVILEVRKAG